MKKILAGLVLMPWFLLLLMAASCPPHPSPGPVPTPTPTPIPTPTPTPSPTPTPDSSMLLRIAPGPVLTNLKGAPVKLRQFIAYYVPNHPEINSGWPGIRKEAMAFFRQYGARAWAIRVGPFIAKCGDPNNDACGESLWFDTGGPYLDDGSMNEKFFAKVDEAVDDALAHSEYVELVILDDWGCKVSQQGNPYNPWITLAPDALAACGKTVGNPTIEKWIRYIVRRYNRRPNIFWQLDQEGDVTPGWKPEHFSWRLSIIRDEEKKEGSGNVHVVVGSAGMRVGADMLYTHAVTQAAPIDGFYGRNNEHNYPDHYNPQVEAANVVNGDKRSDSDYSYWQDDSNDAQSMETLQAIQSGFAGGGTACVAPDGNDPKWQDPPTAPGQKPSGVTAAYNAAVAVVGDRCGAVGQCTPEREPCATPIFIGCIDTSDMIAAELRKQGLCASGSWGGGPEIAILDSDGWWKQYHPCATETGCYTGNPYKYAWWYNGVNPTPPPADQCPGDQPAATAIFCKPQSLIYDCTPWSGGAPVAPESDPLRACKEKKAMSGVPTYTLTTADPIGLEVLSNPMQFKITGPASGTGVVTCTVPRAAGNLCRTATSPNGVPVTRSVATLEECIGSPITCEDMWDAR